MNSNRSLLIAALLAAFPAAAQWPDKPKTDTSKPDASKTDTSKTDASKADAPPPTPPKRTQRASGPYEDDGSGFGLGVRGAWAFPMGGLSTSENLGDSVSGQLPVWLEAGYHINRNLYAGAYFQYAFGFANCLGGGNCSTSGMRFGVEVLYNLAPTAMMQPWAGLGFGYEIFYRTRSGAEDTFKGLELLNLQAGLDFALSKTFTLGPFASYQLLGKYTSLSANGVGNDLSSTGHSWLQVGLKAGIRL